MEYKQVWRFYVQRPENDSVGQEVHLDSDEVHFAHAVLRLSPGEKVELADGNGWTSRAFLKRVDKKAVLAELGESNLHSPLPRKIAAVVGITKPGALDEVVQACVESGIHTLILFRADKTTSRQELKSDKIERQIREACRITKSPWFLKLRIVDSLSAALQMVEVDFSGCSFFICDERPANAVQKIESTEHLLTSVMNSKKGDLAFVVGPEASFSSSEYDFLINGEFSKRIHFVSLGPRILRTPAAVASAAYVLSALVDSGVSSASRNN
jgi:16S rRNA (uracil1498-N3)-methyltransferase